MKRLSCFGELRRSASCRAFPELWTWSARGSRKTVSLLPRADEVELDATPRGCRFSCVLPSQNVVQCQTFTRKGQHPPVQGHCL